MAEADPEAARRQLEKLLIAEQLGKAEANRKLLMVGRSPARLGWITRAALTLLALSVLANLYLWHRQPASADDLVKMRVRNSAIWADVIASTRPLVIVLGDQKGAAVGTAAILGIVAKPGRQMEVRVHDGLQADQIRNNDIIYVGPISGLGPLSGYYQLRSRYRYDAVGSSLTDVDTQKVYRPKGALAGQHMDYALAAKFTGPAGNHIMIFTSGVRNAGTLPIVRTLTSPEGLARTETMLRAKSGGVPESFEALLTVTEFKQTDPAADIIAVDALPTIQLQQRNPLPVANSIARPPQ